MRSINIALISAPDLAFPLDDIQNGIMQGSIEGTLVGNVNSVAGRHGNAIQTDGSSGYVEFALESNNACLQNPDWCSSGITFSMWLMNMPGNTGSTMFRIYFSDACRERMGFCISFLPSGTFSILVFGSSSIYRYKIEISYLPINKWQYVTFTFMPNNAIQLYINGCDAITYRLDGYSLIATFNTFPAVSSYFRLGGGGGWGQYAANMKVDHVLIWYDVLSADEIWQLYVQGGMMLWISACEHIFIL